MPKTTTKLVPESPKSWNKTKKTIADVTAPIKIHGLNLPCFDFVLSTIVPIIGSLIASQIRDTAIIVPTAINCQLGKPSASVKKTSKKLA